MRSGGAGMGILLVLLGCSASRPGAPPGPEAAVAARSSTEAAVPDPPQALPHPPQVLPVDEPKQLTRGTPADYVLYDRGVDETSLVHGIHADVDGVYWEQSSARLIAGAKDGSSPPKQIGQWNQRGSEIASDELHVYWLDRTQIYRRPKAGGETETIQLEAEANGFSVAERYIYAAVWGCPLITRIDKQTLAMESMSIVLDEPGSGPTTVVEDGGEVFCAAWSSVYVIRKWAEPAERLANVADRIWGMVVAGDHVYWLDRHGNAVAKIARVARVGGSPEVFEFSDVFMWVGTTRLVRDASSETLWYSDGQYLVSFATATRTYAVRANDGPIDLSISDGYIYWTAQQGVNGIKRMPLDASVLYHIK